VLQSAEKNYLLLRPRNFTEFFGYRFNTNKYKLKDEKDRFPIIGRRLNDDTGLKTVSPAGEKDGYKTQRFPIYSNHYGIATISRKPKPNEMLKRTLLEDSINHHMY